MGQVSGSQAGFHVSNGNTAVKGRHSSGHCRGGIALNHCQVKLFGGEQGVERSQYAAGGLCQSLARRHDIEVVIRLDIEALQHLVEHRPVLRRYAHPNVQWDARSTHVPDDGTEFDSLWTSAEDE
jgi:hypothetical protein